MERDETVADAPPMPGNTGDDDMLRAMHRELVAARDDYADLYHNAPIGYVTVDPRGCIRRANVAAAALFGVPPAQLLSSNMEELVRDRAGLARHYARVRASDGPQTCELELRGDGAEVARLESLAVRNATRELGMFRTALIDVTERRRMERDLVTARDQLEARVAERTAELDLRLDMILDTATDGILVIGESSLVELANPAAAELFDLERGELVGRPIEELFAGLPPGWKQSQTTELEVVRAQGDTVPVEVSVGAREAGRQYTMIVRDISTRRRLEKEFLEVQKMEAIGRLVSGVAHDFNNLLMGIIGCAKIADESLRADAPARGYLREITRAASSGSEIAKQLLEFGRRQEPRNSRHRLDEIARSAEGMLRRLIREDIELAVETADVDLWFVGDRVHIEQVLINLVVNACDAMPDGGELTVETAAVNGGDGAYARLSVSDTGHGMDEQTREFLFEPFFTTKPPGQGTGLGMATVYAIVTQMHGQVDVTSTVGEGTTIDCYFPLADPPPAATELPPPRIIGRPDDGRTILVVEDEPLVRLAVRHYLRGAGHEVLEAGTASEAVALSEKVNARIDILISDIVLPDGAGREVARAVETRHPGLVPVFMSAHSVDQLVATGRIGSGVPFLRKPFSEDELLAVIAEL